MLNSKFKKIMALVALGTTMTTVNVFGADGTVIHLSGGTSITISDDAEYSNTFEEEKIAQEKQQLEDLQNKEQQAKEESGDSSSVDVNYSAYVQGDGWKPYTCDGDSAGSEGKGLRLEGIKIGIFGNDKLGIEYSAHVQKKGWEDYVSDNAVAGEAGKALRMEAIKVRLTGEDADKYDVYYRVHVQSFGWLDWAKNDEIAGSTGCAKRVESVQIKVVKKGEVVPSATDENKGVSCVVLPSVSYTTHVQRVGWQKPSFNGATAGTTGRSLRLEGIRITTDADENKLGVSYCTHVQKVGWQNPVVNGEMSGTEGRALRLEAIKINLTGEYAKYFDIYYRVHAQHFGWMGWAKNGNPAGTEAYAYRLEGIQIKIVPKGNPAPGSTANAYSKQAPKPTPKPSTSNKGYNDGAIDMAYTNELKRALCPSYSYDGDPYATKDFFLAHAKADNICRAVAEGKMDVETAKRQINSIRYSCYGGGFSTLDFNKCLVYHTKKLSPAQLKATTKNEGYVYDSNCLYAYRHADGTYHIVILSYYN